MNGLNTILIARYVYIPTLTNDSNSLQEAKIGITSFAQDELGDIVHVDIPQVGTKFQKGEILVSIQLSIFVLIPQQSGIESVKTAADVYAPVNGEIVSHNDKVGGDPSLVNSGAENEGWLLKIKY